jgi:hypothetical protein
VRYSDRTNFSAARNTFVDAWCSDHGKALNTIGQKVDSVELVGAKPCYCKVIDVLLLTRDAAQKFLGVRDWLQECESYTGEMAAKRDEDLWRTIACGLTGDGYPVPSFISRSISIS